jgi:hypothetical protein
MPERRRKMVEADPSRGEFELLRDMVKQDHARVENIDINGTRGVSGLQAQVAEVMRDGVEVKNGVEGLRREMNEKFREHDQQHKDSETARIIGRRWLVGASIAMLAMLLSMGGLIIDILVQIHK